MKKAIILLLCTFSAFAGGERPLSMKEYIQQEYDRPEFAQASEPAPQMADIPADMNNDENACLRNLRRYEDLVLKTIYSPKFDEETGFLLDHYEKLYNHWYSICGDESLSTE